MIVADTGGILALIDAGDRHHRALRARFEADRGRWLLPWAILPEVDYLLATQVGRKAQAAFLADLASGAFDVAWGEPADLARARALDARYARLGLGLVDAAVIAVAERVRATAIVTLDLRHFAAVAIEGGPALLPRDLAAR